MESRALCRFYFPFRCPGFCLCPLLSSLLPKECGFPTFRRLLPKEFYTCRSSHPSHKTYIDLSTAGQTSTPSKGVRIPHVPATPSEGVSSMPFVQSQPQDVYQPFRCRTDFHSFQRSADFPRSGDSFRRSIKHAVRPIPATRRISTFPLPDGLPLLPKEYRFPAFQRLLPKEYDIITKESYTPLQCNSQAPFHLMNRHIPIFKQLPGDFQLFRCR